MPQGLCGHSKERKFFDPRLRSHPACSAVNIPSETTNLSTVSFI